MEGVISTATWVDGRFMEREVDIETILSGNTIPDGIKLEVEKPPMVGLLSQTVIDSPNSNWIIPARLGNVNDHDVVFIGDNLVQVKRLVRSGQLSEVGRVANLGSRIRNARALGSIKLDQFSPEQINDNNIEISDSFDYDISDECSNPKEKSNGGLNCGLQVNYDGLTDADFSMTCINTFTVADESGNTTSTSLSEPTDVENLRLGPQMIVLALESGDLMFFFAPDLGPGAPIRPILSRHIIAKTFLGEKPGAHLTADPSSRYLALACSENVVSIHTLRSREAMIAQYIPGQPLSCVGEERYLQIKGVIIKIEFLFPSFKDADYIILLLLIARKGKTRMHVYEWAAGQPLSAIRQNHMKGHLLDECYRIPLLLIPLTIKSAFLLVCEQNVAVCEGLLEGNPQCRQRHIGYEGPSSIHKGRNNPLWTSWTRPVRTEKYAATHDDIYIAREDGLVKYLESNLDEFLCPEMSIEGITCNIGTAFTSLDSKFPGTDGVFGDILVIGGDSCPGGMYWVQAREPARLLATLLNWTPLNDIVTIPSSQRLLAEKQSSLPNASQETFWKPEQIFGCSGRGPYGSISEINRGIEAEIWMELDGLDIVITGAWALPRLPTNCLNKEQLPNNSLSFLFTVGNESLLLTLEDYGSGITGVAEVHSTWLDLSSRTLDASYARGFVTQITERYIRMSDKSPNIIASQGEIPLTYDSSLAIVYSETIKSDELVVAASIYENELACIVFQTAKGEFRIDVFSINAFDTIGTRTSPSNIPPLTKIGPSLVVGFYVTFLSWANPGEQVEYLVIGHAAKEVNGNCHISSRNANERNDFTTSCIYRFHKTVGIIQDDLTELLLSNCDGATLGAVDSCVSALMLSQPESDDDPVSKMNGYGLLLVGHSNGLLFMAYYMKSPDGKIWQGLSMSRQLGSANVKICKDHAYPAAALVCCGSDLYRIVYIRVSSSFPPMTRILLKDSGISIYRQPSIDFVCRFNEGFLAISDKQILGIEINKETTGGLNNLELPGSAQRMLYCETIKSLVIAASVDGRPAIVFLEKDKGTTHVLPLKHTQSSRNTDRILSLAQWWLNTSSNLSLNEELIVAGTKSGTIFVLCRDQQRFKNATLISKAMGFRIYIEQRFDDPIYALLQGGPNDDILFCSIGNTLHSMLININEEMLVSLAEYQLPSHAISMSWDGQFLNVLTAKDSSMTLLYREDGKFQLQFVDESARTGLDHAFFLLDDGLPPGSHSTLLLVSDKDCSVVGLQYQENDASGQIFPREYTTLFEAEMPSCTTKFRLATIRQHWDRNRNELPLRGVISWGNPWEDLLGISIDGSVRKFTLLGKTLLNLLGILQHFARQDPKICPGCSQASEDVPPFDQEDVMKRYIDGDILRGWLDFRSLEEFLTSDASTKQVSATSTEELVSAVRLHWPEKILGLDNNERLKTSVEMVYDLLEGLLGPVM